MSNKTYEIYVYFEGSVRVEVEADNVQEAAGLAQKQAMEDSDLSIETTYCEYWENGKPIHIHGR